MTPSEPGDVVVVEFPFSDLSSGKWRPGLVLASDDSDLLIARQLGETIACSLTT